MSTYYIQQYVIKLGVLVRLHTAIMSKIDKVVNSVFHSLSGFYAAESLVAMILALNRCMEMWNSRVANKFFEGRKAYCWMATTLLYGAYLGLFTIPPSPNGQLVGWFWNPHVVYFEDPAGVVSSDDLDDFGNMGWRTGNFVKSLAFPDKEKIQRYFSRSS